MELTKLVLKEVLIIWERANSLIPLLNYKYCIQKVKKVITAVNLVNQKKVNKPFFNDNLDRLFDVSSCTGDLEEVDCKHRFVHCKFTNGSCRHIL